MTVQEQIADWRGKAEQFRFEGENSLNGEMKNVYLDLADGFDRLVAEAKINGC